VKRRSRKRLAVGAGSACVLALTACSLLTNSDGLTGGSPSAPDGGGGVSTDGAAIDSPTTSADATPDVVIGTPPSGPGCDRGFGTPAASSFTDDFSAGFGGNWQTFGATCVAPTAGELVASPAASTPNDFCIAWTTSLYHLTCDTLTIKVAEATNPILGAQTFIYVGTSKGLLTIIKEAAGFGLSWPPDAGAPTVNLGPYDPAVDVWWRLRATRDELYFETSTDGTTWTTRGHAPVPVSLDSVNIGLGAGVYKSVATPGKARMHCYNAPAGCN
jgi:hypothetical protein